MFIINPAVFETYRRICPLLFNNRELDSRECLSSRQSEDINPREKHPP